MSDIQLPMFDDLRFWSLADLEGYMRQCSDDIRAIRINIKLGVGGPSEFGECTSAITMLEREIAAVKGELAYRSILK